MSTSLKTVQEQIYLALSTDTNLNALVNGRVYDSVPENTVYPYVCIAEYNEKAMNTFGNRGKDIRMIVSIFSRYKGNKEILEIRNALDALLDQKSFTLVGHRLVGLLMESAETYEGYTGGDTTKIHDITYHLWTQEINT